MAVTPNCDGIFRRMPPYTTPVALTKRPVARALRNKRLGALPGPVIRFERNSGSSATFCFNQWFCETQFRRGRVSTTRCKLYRSANLANLATLVPPSDGIFDYLDVTAANYDALLQTSWP
jgi:hypothetical protein